MKRGNRLFGVHIHNVKDLNGRTDLKGQNPFDYISWEGGRGPAISNTYPTYDWVYDLGPQNLPSWIERAAKAAGR